MEEAAIESPSESVSSQQDGSLIDQSQSSESSESGWSYADGVPGVGDKPEFFNEKKYGSVAEQAKAHMELEKKFGGFTGSPEEFELSIDEEISSKLDKESEEFKSFEKFARDSNMNNETFNGLVNQYLKNIDSFQNQEISQEEIDSNRKSEIEKLGENSSSIINEVSAWGKNNLTAGEFDSFRQLASSAENIKVLQKIIRKGSSTKIDPSAAPAQQYTRKDLGKMINEQYYSDIDYRRKVDGLYADYLNKNR